MKKTLILAYCILASSFAYCMEQESTQTTLTPQQQLQALEKKYNHVSECRALIESTKIGIRRNPNAAKKMVDSLEPMLARFEEVHNSAKLFIANEATLAQKRLQELEKQYGHLERVDYLIKDFERLIKKDPNAVILAVNYIEKKLPGILYSYGIESTYSFVRNRTSPQFCGSISDSSEEDQ